MAHNRLPVVGYRSDGNTVPRKELIIGRELTHMSSGLEGTSPSSQTVSSFGVMHISLRALQNTLIATLIWSFSSVTRREALTTVPKVGRRLEADLLEMYDPGTQVVTMYPQELRQQLLIIKIINYLKYPNYRQQLSAMDLQGAQAVVYCSSLAQTAGPSSNPSFRWGRPWPL
jgi:hypothetical protein